MKVLGLGGNLGDVRTTFVSAVDSLQKQNIAMVAHSHAYRTLALTQDGISTVVPHYWNIAIAIATKKSPLQLLEVLHDVESQFGRVRNAHWGSRSLDIDILIFDDQIIDTEDLRVPHPEIVYRPFVIAPLLDLAADLILPGQNTNLRHIYEQQKMHTSILEMDRHWQAKTDHARI